MLHRVVSNTKEVSKFKPVNTKRARSECGKYFYFLSNQLEILATLSIEYFQRRCPDEFAKCESCSADSTMFWNRIVRTLSKTLLSKYVLRTEEDARQAKNAQARREAKRRKL